MSFHPATWHDRQLEHVRAAMAEADKRHTPEEIAAAEAALATRGDLQGQLNLLSNDSSQRREKRTGAINA